MEAAASAEYGYYGGGAGPHETKTAGCGDHFVVDDLLALPPYDDEEEGATGETPLCLQPVKEEEGGLGNFSADSSIVVTAIDSCSNSFSRLADDDFPGEFYEPVIIRIYVSSILVCGISFEFIHSVAKLVVAMNYILTVRPTGGARMAIKLHGRGRGNFRGGGPGEAEAHFRWVLPGGCERVSTSSSGRSFSRLCDTVRYVPAGPGKGP